MAQGQVGSELVGFLIPGGYKSLCRRGRQRYGSNLNWPGLND